MLFPFLSSIILLGGYIAPYSYTIHDDQLVYLLYLYLLTTPYTKIVSCLVVTVLAIIYQQQTLYTYAQMIHTIRVMPITTICQGIIINIPSYSTNVTSKTLLYQCDKYPIKPTKVVVSSANKTLQTGDHIAIQPVLAKPSHQWYDFIQMPIMHYARGTIPSIRLPINKLSTFPPHTITLTFWQYRSVIIKYILQNINSQSVAYGAICALLFGEQQFISVTDWKALKATSTAHLIAISGLHIQMIATAIEFLLTRIVRNKRLTVLITSALLFGYYLLAGLSYSCQRALIMYLCNRLYRQSTSYHPITGLAISACIAFILHPYAQYNLGCILSYGMVGTLLLINYFHKAPSISLETLLTFIGQIPWNYGFWQRIALCGPLANALALPFLSYLVLPTCMLIIPIKLLTPWATPYLICSIEIMWHTLSYYLQIVSLIDFI